MSSAAPAFKAALATALAGLYGPEVQVSYGHPGTYQSDDIVALMGMTSDQAEVVMTPARRREETLTLDVVVSVYRGGTDQQLVTARAYALLAALEDFLQGDGTPGTALQMTAGGTVRKALVTAHEMAESDDPEVLGSGRVTEIRATVTAYVRI